MAGTGRWPDDPSQYTGTNWTNATQIAQLGQILASASRRYADHGRAVASEQRDVSNATCWRAGLPANFWVMNPDVNQANLTRSIGFTSYDALASRAAAPHVERLLRQRQLHAGQEIHVRQRHAPPAAAARSRDTAGVRHALKANWGWEIPVGRGRRFGTNMGSLLNAIAGGWEFDGVGRIQNGNLLSFGNVRDSSG